MTIAEAYENERRRLRYALVAVAIISVLANLCLLAVPLYLFQIYDRVIFSGSVETLLALTLIAGVVLIAFGLLDGARARLLSKVGLGFEARLAGLLLGAELAESSGGRPQTLGHLANVRRALSSNAFPALFDLPAMLIFMIIVFLIHPLLGAVVLAGIVVLLAIALLGEIFTGRHIEDSLKAGQVAQRRMETALRQQEIIASLGMFREVVRDWGERQQHHLAGTLQTFDRASAFLSASKSIRQLIQIALIGTGALLVLRGQLAPGVIFAASIVGTRALAPIEQIIGGWRQLKTARVSMGQLNGRLADLSLPERATPLPRPRGILATRNLVLAASVADAKPILSGITGTFEPGSVTAIIGSSGAGKTTFARCLVGYLQPTRGSVTLDGQDLRAWDPVARGLLVGYLPQVVDFFEASVRDNIARLRRDDDPAKAVEAAEFAHVHQLIMRFPQGYDTIISPQTFLPSGGQRQLLGLARAFYGDPPVIVLDEPNANLDPDGELILQRTLQAAKQAGKTVVVITQRLSIMPLVDNVMLINEGRVEKYGPPSEVVRRATIQDVLKRANVQKPAQSRQTSSAG